MASSGSMNQQAMIPIFKGENFDFWRIKMRTLFKSQELWEIVENGYSENEEEEVKLRESKKKDAKALFFIQQGLHESIFSRISDADSARDAWNTLMQEYQGTAQVKTVRLQSLRREFETLQMQSGENVQEYLSRCKSIVNQMKSFGEQVADETMVAKVLRSLTQKFDHVVAAIEESKDLSKFSFDALMGSLLAHEDRLNRTKEKGEEKSISDQNKQSTSRWQRFKYKRKRKVQ